MAIICVGPTLLLWRFIRHVLVVFLDHHSGALSAMCQQRLASLLLLEGIDELTLL